jgi:hypothetical protein
MLYLSSGGGRGGADPGSFGGTDVPRPAVRQASLVGLRPTRSGGFRRWRCLPGDPRRTVSNGPRAKGRHIANPSVEKTCSRRCCGAYSALTPAVAPCLCRRNKGRGCRWLSKWVATARFATTLSSSRGRTGVRLSSRDTKTWSRRYCKPTLHGPAGVVDAFDVPSESQFLTPPGPQCGRIGAAFKRGRREKHRKHQGCAAGTLDRCFDWLLHLVWFNRWGSPEKTSLFLGKVENSKSSHALKRPNQDPTFIKYTPSTQVPGGAKHRVIVSAEPASRRLNSLLLIV